MIRRRVCAPRERETKGRGRERGGGGGRWMKPLPINAAAAAAAAAATTRPTISTRSVATPESGKARRAKRECAKRRVHFRCVHARNPDTRCALPGDHRARRDAPPPSPFSPCPRPFPFSPRLRRSRRAGTLAGVRNTHVRPLNFARFSCGLRARGRKKNRAREKGPYLCVSQARIDTRHISRTM